EGNPFPHIRIPDDWGGSHPEHGHGSGGTHLPDERQKDLFHGAPQGLLRQKGCQSCCPNGRRDHGKGRQLLRSRNPVHPRGFRFLRGETRQGVCGSVRDDRRAAGGRVQRPGGQKRHGLFLHQLFAAAGGPHPARQTLHSQRL
ncbi:MAG: hypothetical protein AVDCRST_MAG56-4156, partial [uncultured Cytophagales bacterium]